MFRTTPTNYVSVYVCASRPKTETGTGPTVQLGREIGLFPKTRVRTFGNPPVESCTIFCPRHNNETRKGPKILLKLKFKARVNLLLIILVSGIGCTGK